MHVMLVGFIRTVLNVLATCKRRQALRCFNKFEFELCSQLTYFTAVS